MASADYTQPIKLTIEISIQVPIRVDSNNIDGSAEAAKDMIYMRLQQAIAEMETRLSESFGK